MASNILRREVCFLPPKNGLSFFLVRKSSINDVKIFDFQKDFTLFQVLKSFKKLHRTRQLVFKNNEKVLDTVRKEINDKYKENKNVKDGDSIEELIKFASDVTYELKTTVAEFEEVAPGRFKMKLRPEMFEEQESPTPKKLSK